MVIARVCSRWRMVALSTKSLWSSFYLKVERLISLEPLCHLLDLSGPDTALDGLIFIAEPSLHIASFIRRLCEESHRWRNIQFSQLAQEFYGLLDFPEAPILRSFALRRLWPVTNAAVQFPPTFLDHAPNLKYVELHFPTNSYSRMPNLPWTQMRVLDCTIVGEIRPVGIVPTALFILRQSPCLFSLGIKVQRIPIPGGLDVTESRIDASPILPFEHRGLSTLTLFVHGFEDPLFMDYSLLCNSVTLPSLQSLHLKDDKNPSIDPFLDTLFRQSSFHLRNLSLRGIQISPPTLLRLLEQLSDCLECISLDSGPFAIERAINATTIQALTPMAGQEKILCPKLQRIDWDYCFSEVEEKSLLDFIRARTYKRVSATQLHLLKSVILRGHPGNNGQTPDVHPYRGSVRVDDARKLEEGKVYVNWRISVPHLIILKTPLYRRLHGRRTCGRSL